MEENGGGKVVLLAGAVIVAVILVVIPIVFIGPLVLWLPLVAGGAASAVSGGSKSSCVAAKSHQRDEDIGASANIPEEYRQDVIDAARVAEIPPTMVYYQIQKESGWNPKAYNPKSQAAGVAQFIPGTWAAYGDGGDVQDVRASLRAYGKFMATLRKQMAPLANGDEQQLQRLMLAAYNWGPGNVLGAGGDFSAIPETQNYVSKIMSWTEQDTSNVRGQVGEAAQKKQEEHRDNKDKEKDKKADDDSSKCTSGDRGKPTDVDTTGNDDYPWKDMAYCDASYTSCPSQPDPTGGLPRECVAFAAWRMNQSLGGNENDIKFHSPGNAVSWYGYWSSRGWGTGNAPAKGAVVYYANGAGGSNPQYGHVAVVKDILDDGTFIEEGYNGLAAPNDHRYYTRKVSNNTPTAFLYVNK